MSLVRPVFAAALLALSEPSVGAQLSAADELALRQLSNNYAKAWVENDRAGVMANWAGDSVFIPHDGVQPRVGYQNIDQFWFPGGKAVGVVPAYTQTITDISGADDHATVYGRFDLTWQNSSKSYNWIGNWLIVARKDRGRWLITHMMANDADPTVADVKP